MRIERKRSKKNRDPGRKTDKKMKIEADTELETTAVWFPRG